ncbi:hypothetical protein VTO73DRAFT_9897 [Trametes versicolor]
MSHQTTSPDDPSSEVATDNDTPFSEAGAVALHAPSQGPEVDPNRIIVDGRIEAGTLLRLHRIVDMSDQQGRLFSMTMLPDDTLWLQRDAEPVLGWKMEPLHIRVIGNLVGVDYKASRNQHAILNIEVELLRQTDMQALRVLKSNAMCEAAAPSETIVFKRIVPGQLQVFEDIYDASARIRPKHLMPRLGLSSLMIGDVVAVECLCFRTYSQRGQDVAFELQSLLLNQKAYGNVDEDSVRHVRYSGVAFADKRCQQKRTVFLAVSLISGFLRVTSSYGSRFTIAPLCLPAI